MQMANAQRIRVYSSETEQYEGTALYKWLISAAHQHGLAGATAIRAMEGFGSDGQLHTSKVLRLSADLPVIVEIIDAPDKIDNFLSAVDSALAAVLVTSEPVSARLPGRGD